MAFALANKSALITRPRHSVVAVRPARLAAVVPRASPSREQVAEKVRSCAHQNRRKRCSRLKRRACCCRSIPISGKSFVLQNLLYHGLAALVSAGEVRQWLNQRTTGCAFLLVPGACCCDSLLATLNEHSGPAESFFTKQCKPESTIPVSRERKPRFAGFLNISSTLIEYCFS